MVAEIATRTMTYQQAIHEALQIAMREDPTVILLGEDIAGGAMVDHLVNDDAWGVVKNTPGVTGFVGAGGKPVPLSQPEVDRILRTGVATADRPRAQVEFSLGESVKVTSGPLSDFDGEIVDVNGDQQKLKVLVNIFERQVPVELSFDQVKKLD